MRTIGGGRKRKEQAPFWQVAERPVLPRLLKKGQMQGGAPQAE
jgi:hypothetical protein